MKKLLFHSSWRFDDEAVNGIAKKIRAEIRAFTRAGFAVDYSYIKNGRVMLTRDGTELPLGRSLPYVSRMVAAARVSRAIEEMDQRYDFAYIRYAQSDPALLGLLALLRERGVRTLIEIPSYPYDKECTFSLPLRLSLALDKSCRNRLSAYVERIATFSRDAEIFGIPAIAINNGVDFAAIPPANKEGPEEDIHLVAVAGLMPWHGYDRIIRAMGGDRQAKAVLHIVGDGMELNRYKKLVDALGLRQRVFFYGFLGGAALDAVFDRADAGVSALGAHRKDCAGGSPLKAVEYFARGLPVLTAGSNRPFPAMEPYILNIPGDESLPDMNEIASFVREVYRGKTYAEVHARIRAEALVCCSMDAVMKPVIDYMWEGEAGV